MEENENKLPENTGKESGLEKTETNLDSENTVLSETEKVPETEVTEKEVSSTETEEQPIPEVETPTIAVLPTENVTNEEDNNNVEESTATTEETPVTADATSESKSEDTAVIEEIEESNAEDAEDKDNEQRHEVVVLDYHAMNMENLVGELQKLVKNEKVQAIHKHVSEIKHEFDLKFQEFLEHKKEEFISSGGNEIDFRYNSVTKRQFNEVYSEYREKKNQYYKSLEQNLKENLTKRLQIIDELKSLINVEEDINTTYKNFKGIQERWRYAGPIPRAEYNNVWRTYHHHIEIFYDFLHLNRELRDLDFKHNYEEKLKLTEQAEALAQEHDLSKAFRILQTLHKVWKEDIGPVGKEHREEIWERFSNATKAMHSRRQAYYNDLDKVHEENLVRKDEIILAIQEVSANAATSHKALQQQIKKIEALREDFFKAGKVPQKQNEKTWAAFKEAVRGFNRNKNNYYKNIKKEQQDNLNKKKALLQRATELKDSEEWDTTTTEMKRIQSDWKKIGHVPRKYSDKIWNEFKNTCNHYFDKLHSQKNAAFKEETVNLEKKSECLDRLKAYQLSGEKGKDLAAIKDFINEWKSYGHVPFNKKSINTKFNKILDAIFNKLDINKQESELLRYGDKIQQLAKVDNEYAIQKERAFIRRKIEESNAEIRQLENNMQFFSNASEDNPLVKDVIKNINNHKESLETWKAKLKRLNIMENNLGKEVEEVETDENSASEEE